MSTITTRDRRLPNAGLGTLARVNSAKDLAVASDIKPGRQRGGIKFHANTDRINIVKDPAMYRADREMNLAHFKELMNIFRLSSNSNTGTMSLEDFKSAFATVLGKGLTDEQMSILFMKIDANTDNEIDWDDFSTYMLLRAEGQKLMLEEAETRLFDADITHYPTAAAHKDIIVRIQYIESLKRYMSCSREGTLCYWNDRLKLQRAYKNAGQLCQDQIDEKRNQQAKTQSGSQHIRWIHDAVFMENVNKVALASDDHQITIHDGTTLEKALCFDLQNVNVLTLDYWTDKNNSNSTESMLFYGTDSGYVNVFTFNNDKMFKIGVRQKDHAEHIFLEKKGASNKALKNWGTLWKRRAHGDWAVKVKYIHDLHAIISCSPDPKESLVVAIMDYNRKWKVHVSPVHKGVNAFAYCRTPVALITGGTDRQLRLWNPHRLNHPIAAMKGHNSPIIDITVNELNGQVISLSVDTNIKIWDIRKQQCLQTISDSSFQKDDLVPAIMFNPHAKSIIAGIFHPIAYHLKEQTAVTETPKSHDFPIRSVMYNPAFKQVVSGCDGGVVNVWDALSGQKTFRFSEVHGKSEITAMSFDASGRRLATGGRDGTIKIWNFNNGQLLQELVKKDKTEVTGLAFIDMRDSMYFVATGWNRKITMFINDPDSLTVYPTFTWPDPTLSGGNVGRHEDDILSMAFCPPNILATSSYDGEIVICNLHSGHVLHKMRPIGKEEQVNRLKSKSIDKVLFLPKRNKMREAGSLVSAGSDGQIRFWNIILGTLLLEIDGTQGRNEGVFTMISNTPNTLLFTADALGWVNVFDIKETAINEYSPAAMPLVVSFHAHVRSVTSMDIIESQDVIITSSADCTIRMHTFKGEYIGIFGQSTMWELGNPQTYKHPLRPVDVLEKAKLEAERADALAEQANRDAYPTDLTFTGAHSSNRAPLSNYIANGPKSSLLGSLSKSMKYEGQSRLRQNDAFATTQSVNKLISSGFESTGLYELGRGKTITIPPLLTQTTTIPFSQINHSTPMLNTEVSHTQSFSTQLGKATPAINQQSLMQLPPIKPIQTYNSKIESINLGTTLRSYTRIKTADLFKNNNSSWYARSQYAHNTFQTQNKRKSHLKPLNIGQGTGLRVYYSLQPYELKDVDSSRLTAAELIGVDSTCKTEDSTP
ncbi:hypothetical protein BATDEDRAFT_27169 [Batrachochytrium dendrobatidis JAM81]|uniref:EF-hand domain-containing protein n=2 Tax=Batrachochytrium dendrobatidis TaxID=109871 RepID=F4P9T5_BATDJ|nr:uncharacterized protein BATDEDRAFT_27169 [Batrachochytrium dendrobatidis JAM81]EGF77863.1 hypothetical protein BATDEDRAFT_27169 [Batrachochytrium dendrobatidis JAM81]KAJ8330160.1 hypothetical protein O5D80_001733 [Batrachochytrium dendrobatidis]OAJ44050.1 hypothetical protein BDEG_27334 [Batrachochytrium dendrobatidis JEL423]|eukprot:XP_006681395.1 hypothetical protein BATDEDRAFT_27169 [Batrachochytrium dendrobatidis JAM81]